MPAPGKLLPLQKWGAPKTITQLRKFLGVTNYFSEYVPNYAQVVAPLMAKLKVGRVEGRAGSQKPVHWEPSDLEAFEELKHKLADNLGLWQPHLDQPFCVTNGRK